MQRRSSLSVLALAVLVLSLWLAQSDRLQAQPKPTASGPSKVRVEYDGLKYSLLVNGERLFLRGAGLDSASQEALAARGANAFRTWRPESDQESGRQVLDRAQKNGLFVALGLDVARERHGFDYDDPRAVLAQKAAIKRQVLRYKDHAALLMWVVGNELNLESRNPRVWNALNDIIEMIAELDPNHPAMTTLAGFDAELIGEIRSRAPALQLIGVQLYGDIAKLRQLRAAGWSGPYVVTEWGPTGHWEVAKTTWGAPVEEHSGSKAERLIERYQQHILSDPTHCLGSFVFLWGHKQERTPTWYGMFLDTGEATPAVDAMQWLWSGVWPANRSPLLKGMTLGGRVAGDDIRHAPGQQVEAVVEVTDPDGDPLDYHWQVLAESTAKSVGGDQEQRPAQIATKQQYVAAGHIRLQLPDRPGAYRLFLIVRDGQGNAAHANVPFLVETTDWKP